MPLKVCKFMLSIPLNPARIYYPVFCDKTGPLLELKGFEDIMKTGVCHQTLWYKSDNYLNDTFSFLSG